MSKLPDWIPPAVKNYYPYLINVATKRVVTIDNVFTEKESRELWKQVELAYESPRMYLHHITVAFMEAKDSVNTKGGSVAIGKEYLKIQKVAEKLILLLVEKRELDYLFINMDVFEKQNVLKGLIALHNGDEYAAEDSMHDHFDSQKFSKKLEILAHEAGEMAESVRFHHSFVNTEVSGFVERLFRLIDANRTVEYKIIHLSCLAIFEIKFDVSKHLSDKNII